MSFNSTIFTQLLQEVNRYDFQNQVSKYNGDKKAWILKCFPILVIMMFTQLKKKDSLRDIETGMNLIRNQFYHLGLKEVKRSSLSDALKVRPHEVYEEYYYKLLEKLNSREKRRFKRKVKSLDSSTISLCLQKFGWAKYKSTKSGIKLHVLFDNDLLIPVKIFLTNAKAHDIEAVKIIKFKENELYVFDRGYNDYKYWYNIELAKSFFVTRLKSNAKIETIKNVKINKKSKKAGVVSDLIIRLTGNKANDYSKKLRLVVYYDKKIKKTFRFVTNNFNIKSEEIAAIYKDRWQIELFFKWIKQHLKIKKIISTSENGLKIQIWIALITYLLLMIIKLKLTINYNMFELLRRIQDCLNTRIDIYELLSMKFQDKIPKQDNEKYLWEIKFV